MKKLNVLFRLLMLLGLTFKAQSQEVLNFGTLPTIRVGDELPSGIFTPVLKPNLVLDSLKLGDKKLVRHESGAVSTYLPVEITIKNKGIGSTTPVRLGFNSELYSNTIERITVGGIYSTNITQKTKRGWHSHWLLDGIKTNEEIKIKANLLLVSKHELKGLLKLKTLVSFCEYLTDFVREVPPMRDCKRVSEYDLDDNLRAVLKVLR